MKSKELCALSFKMVYLDYFKEVSVIMFEPIAVIIIADPHK